MCVKKVKRQDKNKNRNERNRFEQSGETQQERKKHLSLSYEERDKLSKCLKIQL